MARTQVQEAVDQEDATSEGSRRVTWHPSRGARPALWYFTKDVGVLRVVWNWTCLSLAKYTPWFRPKNWWLRRTGMKVGKGVALGFSAQPDLLFPGDITLEDDCTVGYGTTLLCHGYLHDRYQRGPVTVGRRATVGADCTILPGVTIGEGAVIAAKSLVNRDVPEGEFWGGIPARRLGTVAERFPPLVPASRNP
ncbi:MAG: acyltransferase [Euryarchaeota archaeon]|nr:acyltransferase [Euryarchaeota archaeon]